MRIELYAKKRTKLPCSICGKGFHPKDTLTKSSGGVMFLCEEYLCSSTTIQGWSTALSTGLRWKRSSGAWEKGPLVFLLSRCSPFGLDCCPRIRGGRPFNVSWNAIRAVAEAADTYGIALEDYRGVRFIGTDEVSRKHGHTYHTNVYDLDRKSEVHRDKDSLRRFFEVWGGERTADIEGVCCDM